MKNVAIAVAVVLAGVWVAWPSGSDEASQSFVAEHVHDGHGHAVFDRLWVSEMPTEPKQKIDYFIAVHEQGPFGVFGRTSAYEGEFSTFEYRTEGKNKMVVKMLQSDKKSKVRYKVKTEGCESFDMCLVLKGAPKGSKRYYSMEDWVIEGGADTGRVQEQVRDLLY